MTDEQDTRAVAHNHEVNAGSEEARRRDGSFLRSAASAVAGVYLATGSAAVSVATAVMAVAVALRAGRR
jgi:hypothetical protein